MKTIPAFTILLILAALLAACASGGETTAPQAAPAEATPTSFAAAYLSIEYADAASLRNQLAYGTIKLEGGSAITAEQAKTLLPFWQALKTLSGSTTTTDEELNAVQNQIVEAMTPAQLQAIAAMQITNTALNSYYAEFGISMPTPVPGVTRVPGSNSGLTTEEKEATRTAAQALGTPVGTGSGQAAKTLLYDQVIEMLTGLAGN